MDEMKITFASLKEVLEKAKSGNYAVGAFNISNLEITRALVEAAKDQNSPLILAVSPTAIRYAGIEYIHQIARIAAIEADVPVVLHLDHGTSFEECIQCINYGWSSVMFDGSNLPINVNIEQTREIVKIAHAAGVSVEAELGKIAGVEGFVSVEHREATYTDPYEAKRFVCETGVDALAVAIGTSHGAYKFKGEGRLDLVRLRTIEELVKIPLVLHGASSVPKEVLERAAKYGAKLPGATGVPDDVIRGAIGLGVTKINIATDIKLALVAAIRQVLIEYPEEFEPVKIFGPAGTAIKEVAIQKMKLFGSSGKA